MSKRRRKLVGAVLILAIVVLYAPIAMALAESRIVEAPKLVQAVAYMVLGLAWIVLVMPVVTWMERPEAS